MNSDNNDSMLGEAQRLYDDGKTGKAIEICQQVLADSPQDAHALLLNARALRRNGRLQDAAGLLQLIGHEDLSADSLLELGSCLQQLGRLDQALDVLLQAYKYAPGRRDVLKRLAKVMYQMGRHDEVVELLERVIRQHAERFGDVYPDLIRSLLAVGKAGKALEYCNTRLRIVPADRFALAFKYIALANLGEIESAGEIIDTENFVKIIKIGCPPGFASISDFNAYLAEHILHHTRINWEPPQYSTRGGWQSEVNKLFESNPSLGKTMLDFIGKAQDEYLRLIPPEYQAQSAWSGFGSRPRSIEAWAVVLGKDGAQSPHIHPTSWLSGAYYISVPDALNSDNSGAGNFVVGCGPGYLHSAESPGPLSIRPEEGVFCIFPSFYWHNTVPTDSDRQRICIAFDWLM